MNRTVTMDFESLGADHDDDDSFFDSCGRLSSAVPLDLASGSDDDEEFFEASRMSFVSQSIKRIYSIEPAANSSSSSIMLPGYDMWIAEPGDVKERRKRLLQGMGLCSNKDFLRIATSKVVRAISIKVEPDTAQIPAPTSNDNDPSPSEESKSDESAACVRAIVLVRSRSDSDIQLFSTKQRKIEIIGPISKNRLTRTSSGQLVPSTGACQYSCAVKVFQESEKNMPSVPDDGASQCVSSDTAFGSFFLIKNLDTGKDFIVKEFNEQGMWNKLNDVQTGKQLTIEEFEKSVGHSPVVKELMRRMSRNIHNEGGKGSQFTKSFRNSTKKGTALLKNIKGVATSVSGILVDKEEEANSAQVEQKVSKCTSQWIYAHQQGKSLKEFTALYLSQEIQAHEGSIWVIRFSSDARFLASAGEDTVIHVWEVQDCEVMPPKKADDQSSADGAPVPPTDGDVSNRPPLVEISSMPSEMRKKGRKSGKGNSIPDYVKVPETVLTLSEKPICTFKGHNDEVLDLSWSKSQLLLSSSMDKTVRMWDMETKSCLKIFAHKDYVTCVQFNPVAENYFISGSLDGKVRIWSIPDHRVVDWTDVHEMVTAASYTPDGQGAVVGSQQGSCKMYSTDDSRLEHRMDIHKKKKSQAKKFPAFQSQAKKIPGFQSQTPPGKITGFQFAPWNPSEVLVTSADSRIGIYDGPDLIQKYRGFKNTSSQISASFSPDGKHIISASEDSQVYIWKVEESKNSGSGKRKGTVTLNAHEHFHCKDVSVAITWPGSRKIEPPVLDLHPKKNSKRSTGAQNPVTTTSPTREEADSLAGSGSSSGLPPFPKKKKGSEKNTSSAEEDSCQSVPADPAGICNSDSVSDGESVSASASTCPSQTQLPDNASSHGNIGGQTVHATAWGMVIVAASLEGEIRVYQNFGLPLKIARQAYLF